MKTATPQDTWDHTIGAGGLEFPWWLDVETVKGIPEGKTTAPDDWEYVITADNGDDGRTKATLNHTAVMSAIRKIAAKDCAIPGIGSATIREARHLIFNVDETDFDACTADEVLQVIVLGEIIFE